MAKPKYSRDANQGDESTAEKATKVCLDAIAELLTEPFGEVTITLRTQDNQIVFAEVGTVKKIKLV